MILIRVIEIRAGEHWQYGKVRWKISFLELSGMVTSQTVPLTFGILVDRLQSITRYNTKRTSAFATQYCEKADQKSLQVFTGWIIMLSILCDSAIYTWNFPILHLETISQKPLCDLAMVLLTESGTLTELKINKGKIS